MGGYSDLRVRGAVGIIGIVFFLWIYRLNKAFCGKYASCRKYFEHFGACYEEVLQFSGYFGEIFALKKAFFYIFFTPPSSRNSWKNIHPCSRSSILMQEVLSTMKRSGRV